METTKKAIEWLNMLSEPERSQAMMNCEDLDRKYKSLFNCICDSFYFDQTKEGQDYWQKIVIDIDNETYPFKEPEIAMISSNDYEPIEYVLPMDIYKLIDQLIKEGKNQGYKISVTIE